MQLAAAYRSYALWTVAAVVVLALAWALKHSGEITGAANAEKARTLHLIDSVQAANKSLRDFLATAHAENDSLRSVGALLDTARRDAERRARIIHVRIESLPPLLDTATTVPRPRYQLVITERDAWALAYVKADSGRVVAEKRVDILGAAGDSLARGWLGTRTALAGAEKIIKKLTVPCRIVAFIPCPSRTVTLVAGVVGGVLVSQAVQK